MDQEPQKQPKEKKEPKEQKEKEPQKEKKAKGPPPAGAAPAAPKAPPPPAVPTLGGTLLKLLAGHPKGLSPRDLSALVSQAGGVGKRQNFRSVVSGTLHQLRRAEKVVLEAGVFRLK